MKILFLSHYSFLYGSNRSLFSLVKYFQKRGEDVTVLLPSKGKFYEYLQEHGYNVHSFMFIYESLYIKNNIKYLSLPLLWLYNLLIFPFLIYKIHKINPDIIYTNSSVDGFSIWIAKLLGKKHVVHVREFMEEDFGGHFIYGKKAKRYYLSLSDKIIFVSKAVMNAVMLSDIPKNCKVIYNGLPLAKQIKELQLLKTNLRIGVVGNLDISKQQHIAILAMKDILKHYPQITLHIIGDKECPYKQYLHKLVKENHLENSVRFDGFVNDVNDIYKHFDVLLMCSRCEAFGRVTIEAMMRNVPVIGLNTGGTAELINHGVTGFKYEDINDIIAALDVLINDPGKAKDIRMKAKEFADKEFTELCYADKVYQFVINKS